MLTLLDLCERKLAPAFVGHRVARSLFCSRWPCYWHLLLYPHSHPYCSRRSAHLHTSHRLPFPCRLSCYLSSPHPSSAVPVRVRVFPSPRQLSLRAFPIQSAILRDLIGQIFATETGFRWSLQCVHSSVSSHFPIFTCTSHTPAHRNFLCWAFS